MTSLSLSKTLLSLALIASVSGTTASAATISEGTDFAGSQPLNPVSIATLGLGQTTIIGSLMGTCVGPAFSLDCNTLPSEDTQDSFRITIAQDTAVVWSTYSYQGTGPAILVTSIEKDGNDFFRGSDFIGTSGLSNMDFANFTAGDYDISVFGGPALSGGAYDATWSLTFDVVSTAPEVSAVPLPASSLLLLGGLAGLGAIHRKRTKATSV